MGKAMAETTAPEAQTLIEVALKSTSRAYNVGHSDWNIIEVSQNVQRHGSNETHNFRSCEFIQKGTEIAIHYQ